MRLRFFACFCYWVLLLAVGCSDHPEILSTTPDNLSTGEPQSLAEITVKFSAPMKEDTVTNPANFIVEGTRTGKRTASATYDDPQRLMTITVGSSGDESDGGGSPGGLTWLSSETVQVTLTHGIRGRSLVPIETYIFQFRIRDLAVGPTGEETEVVVVEVDPER